MDAKEKTTLADVKKEIAPYLTKPFLQKAFIESDKVSPVCSKLRRKYRNVEITPKPGSDGKPYLKVKVKGFLSGGELTYEIKIKGKSIRTHDPLSWIDRIEEFDAIM
jgi:hypothetical protein